METCSRSRLVACGLLVAISLGATSASAQPRSLDAARNEMVDEMIACARLKSQRVIEALRKTPRHEFVPPNQRKYAYLDMAVPIGEKQAISAPFIVACMTESIDPQPGDKVLEIGTGSGYQAAVLAGLVRDVYSIEIVEKLGQKAEQTLKRLHYDNVHVKLGDGYQGWPENAPFDKIIVTCSPEKAPPALVEQLKEGGRMVIPVGELYEQTLCLLKKTGGKMVSEAMQPTMFVPMTGAAEASREKLPDGANPAIRNGGFENVSGDPPTLTNWYFQRQLKVVAAPDAPEGEHYVTFSNSVAGRTSHALQSFAVDGRKITMLQLKVAVRAKDVGPGQTPQQLPRVLLKFFDENRVLILPDKEGGDAGLGTWRGTFGWRTASTRVNVPSNAREGNLCIGLLGAVGEVSFDALEVKAVKK